MKKTQTIGQKLSPVFDEIEGTLWEHEAAHPGIPPGYTLFGFRGAVKIFMSALLDKMWDLQEKHKLPQKVREEVALIVGKEIRAIIKLRTGIDTFELYEK